MNWPALLTLPRVSKNRLQQVVKMVKMVFHNLASTPLLTSVAAATTLAPAFTCFPQLPVEIQNLIWGHCFKISRVLSPLDNDEAVEILEDEPLPFQRDLKTCKNSGPRPPPALHACKAAREEGKRHGYFAFGVRGSSFRGIWFNPNYDTILLSHAVFQTVPGWVSIRYFKDIRRLIIHRPINYDGIRLPASIHGLKYAEQDQRDRQWNAELSDVWGPEHHPPYHQPIYEDEWDTPICMTERALWIPKSQWEDPVCLHVWELMPSCRSVCIAATHNDPDHGPRGLYFHRVDDEHVFIQKRWKDFKAELLSGWQPRVKDGLYSATVPPHLSMYDARHAHWASDMWKLRKEWKKKDEEE
ncbi:hypothetical protein CC79DRAFT_362966 [Sarocladium strictum]